MARRFLPALLTTLAAWTVAAVASAQEPEQLPPPKQMLPAPPPSYYVPYPAYALPPAPPPPMNSREGWRYFAPNAFGQMRPRVVMALRKEGKRHGRNRVARLMNAKGLYGRQQRRYRVGRRLRAERVGMFAMSR